MTEHNDRFCGGAGAGAIGDDQSLRRFAIDDIIRGCDIAVGETRHIEKTGQIGNHRWNLPLSFGGPRNLGFAVALHAGCVVNPFSAPKYLRRVRLVAPVA